MSIQSLLKPNNYDLFARTITTASGGSVDLDNIIFHTLTQDNGNSSINASGSFETNGRIVAGQDITASGSVISSFYVLPNNPVTLIAASGAITNEQLINGNIGFTSVEPITVTLPSASDIVARIGAGNIGNGQQFDCIMVNTTDVYLITILNDAGNTTQIVNNNGIVLQPKESVYFKFNIDNVGTPAVFAYANYGRPPLPLSSYTNGTAQTSLNLTPAQVINGVVYVTNVNADNFTQQMPTASDIINYLGSGNFYNNTTFNCDFYYNIKTASGGTYGNTIALGTNCLFFGGANGLGFTQASYDPATAPFTNSVHVGLKYQYSGGNFVVYPSVSGSRASS